jgi:hypothetical protein
MRRTLGAARNAREESVMSRRWVLTAVAALAALLVLVVVVVTGNDDGAAPATTASTVPELQLTEMNGTYVGDEYARQLFAFHEALASGDLTALDSTFAPAAIVDADERSIFWHDPARRAAALDALSTHPATTDGLTYPGFMLAGFTTPPASADGDRLGLEGSAEPPANGIGYSQRQANYTGFVLSLEDEPASADRTLVVVSAGPWTEIS